MATMNPNPRQELIDAGVRLLERDGPQALKARTVAAEVGVSTMAVYTHFGGMAGLVDAIAEQAFARFADTLTQTPHTEDPVADFLAMGGAYRRFALANPQHYQLIFGSPSPRERPDVDVSTKASVDRSNRSVSFDALLDAVRRMIDAGRIRDGDVAAMAGRLWSLIHGAVMLELAGFFGHEGHGLTLILGPLTVDVLVGMGDDRDSATESLLSAANSAPEIPNLPDGSTPQVRP
jgi:AcrR family transcriptional regulator